MPVFDRLTNRVGGVGGDIIDADHFNGLYDYLESLAVDRAGAADTFLVTVIVAVTANPGFSVVKADGSNVFFVRTDTPIVSLSNGCAFNIYSDNAFATPKFSVAGSTGNTTIAGALDHDGSTVGFFGVTPVTRRPANANTSGATLAALETEVNELKQLLRDYGLLT